MEKETEPKIKTPEELRKENLAKIVNFKLMDDIFMNAFFNGQRELVQFVLRIILNKKSLVVTSVQVQKTLKNIQGRSLTLDVHAVDSDGTEYDIEIQQESSGAIPKRARHHSSMMDSNALLQNDDFEKLPETYVIFITSKDYWEKGLPLYTINRHIEELEMMPFDDEEHIIYVNGEYINDTPIGKLMHDFKCTEPNEMIYPNLAERASYLKNTKGGYEDMCQIMEESNKEYAKQKAYQAAMKLIRKGILSKEDIADALELTIKDVEALTKMVKANA